MADPATQGSDSSKIIDAWVYSNDSVIGGFRVPATVPIIGFGNMRISVLGGVAENGNFANPQIYPFFDKYETTIANRPGKTDTVRPVFRYSAITSFALLENFEQGNTFGEDIDKNTLTSLQSTTETAFTGNSCGKISLDAVNNVCRVGSRQLTLLRSRSQIWAELNYKSNNTFAIGVIGYRDTIPLIGAQEKVVVAPRGNWNKIYINLTQELKTLNVSQYRLIISASKDAAVASPLIYVDDVKILEF